MKRGAAIAAALLVAGCTVGPDYHPQKMQTPDTYAGLPADADQAPIGSPVAKKADVSQWWLQFGDVELNKLIAEALQSNLDLLTAASRVREARQQEIIAGAVGLPQIGATGLATTIGGAGHSTSGNGTSFFWAGFDASWELDLFGGGARSSQAAEAGTEATIWQMRDGEVALTAEIAADYIRLRADQERIAILRGETRAQQDLLTMIKARAGAGFVTELDVNQQNSLVDSTLAQIPELEGDTRIRQHAIAVLLAEQPDAMASELDRSAPIPAVPSSLPVGLPSDLLRQRPDVRQAERQLAAATAEVGVAVSDLFPKFDLLGAIGLTGGNAGILKSAGNLGQVGLGSISWPLFRWGQTEANVRVKEEQAKQAYYAYQKSVLGAVQNVEDALARYMAEQRRLVALERAEAAARSSTAIAIQQFRAGTVTYVNVLVAEAAELSLRDQLVQSQQILAGDLIYLYKALGGGWLPEDAKDARAGRPSSMLDEKSAPASTGLREIVAHDLTGLRSGIFPTPGDFGDRQAAGSDGAHDAELQLGAWRSEDAATSGWEQAQQQAGDLLRGLDREIIRADVPGKGLYYRLRIKAMGSTNPSALCQALRDKGLQCILASK